MWNSLSQVHEKLYHSNKQEIIWLTLIGTIVGVVGGILGGGADVLIVPLLLVFGISSNIKTAIGTSLAALLPPIGIFAVYQIKYIIWYIFKSFGK